MKQPSAFSHQPSAIALAALVAFASSATAQVRHQVEIGLEAGIGVGLIKNADDEIQFPIGAFRTGFFLDNTTSIEARISANHATNGADFTAYRWELGFMYHFFGRKRQDLFPELMPRRQAYIRPFGGRERISIVGINRNEDVLGIGVGAKIPLSRTFLWRSEANTAHIFRHRGLDGEGFNALGLLSGISIVVR